MAAAPEPQPTDPGTAAASVSATLRMTFALLTGAERRGLWGLFFLVVLMAVAEVVAALSVMPFLAVLADPALVDKSGVLRTLEVWMGGTREAFLIRLGLLTVAVLVVAAAVRIAGNYALIRWAHLRRHTIGTRLLEGYLARPYAYFLNRHSGDMAKVILSEVDQTVTNVLLPGVMMLGQIVTLVALALLLLAVDPGVALAAGAVLVGGYLAIYAIVRGPVDRAGAKRITANAGRFQAAQEALQGIKAIRLTGREHAWLQRFSAPSSELARNMVRGSVLANLPRYGIEAMAMGGVLVLALVLVARSEGALGEVLPLLGLFAFAGYRMLPAIQTVYRGVTQIRFGAASVEALRADLADMRALSPDAPEPLALTIGLSLKDVDFAYPGAGHQGLTGISFELPRSGALGIVGGTGAGKSTLVDVILGLLEPSAGEILVDGRALDSAARPRWRASVGYVPQDIFLIDASVAENIALGLGPEAIDRDAVRRAARMARIDTFIEEQLESGYDTRVGERGIRLSGGQRQRIGIARALYSDPEVIVFDEATSALDSATEAEVMAAIEELSGQKTLILVAHRLSTLKGCDRILVMQDGRMAGLDTYDRLAAGNDEFRKIAGAGQAV